MTTPLRGAVRLAAISVAELRLKIMGPAPQSVARMVYLTDDHVSAVQVHFGIFSAKTRKLVAELCRSIEEDFIEVISVSPSDADLSGDETVENDGISFEG